MPKKQCPRCGSLKDATDFGFNSTRSDGLAFYCKDCFHEKAKEHYRLRRAALGKTVRSRVRPPDGFKWCPDCNAHVELEKFPRNRSSRDGLNSYCKAHHNIRGARTYFPRTYGITYAQVEQMIEEQAGLCLICSRELGDKPHVDHDHETGAVRGILCFNCNGGLGQFGDDIGRLRQAVEYLEGNLRPSARVAAQAEQRLLELLDQFGRAA